MVTPDIQNGILRLRIEGWDKLWAFKSESPIPLEHITSVRLDEEIVKKWYHGFKMPGSSFPGIITAGTFYQNGKRVFWDIHNPKAAVVISLNNEKYNELVIEVENPEAFVTELQEKIG